MSDYQLFHGDCLDILPTLSGVDAIVTDPMYFQPLNMPEFLRVCRGNIVAFGMPTYRYFQPDKVHHWVKPTSTKNVSREMAAFVEEITVLRRGVYRGPKETGMQWANYNGVWFDIIEGEKLHDFQKPLSLMMRLIEIYTNPGDTILDPYAGSGTTILAAVLTGRNAIGIEKERASFETMQRRIQNAQPPLFV
jgi:DNA modification methylase